MAKKKSKSKNSALKYIKFGAILLAVVGILMALLPYGSYKIGNDAINYSGFQVIFGYSETIGSGSLAISSQVLSFSFVALLAILLPLLGSLCAFIDNKIVKLVGAVLMIAGGVLCFLVTNFVVFTNVSVTLSLGIGAILSGIFFILGSLCLAFDLVRK